MLDELLPQVELIQQDGALVLLKWDGERSQRRCTVVITRRDTDFVWRKDTDEIGSTLAEALSDYWAFHAK